eukprot:TRINITY_DN1662_c0_g1_i11.p1 TRINITY_DN1662_c0_g1~~TRINITY_DN1662_c0_g1_i11.p1  ORF type:complete len:309 (-),score=46.25 TRINITY_DN1662_c0_g1_i11:13-939(-)
MPREHPSPTSGPGQPPDLLPFPTLDLQAAPEDPYRNISEVPQDVLEYLAVALERRHQEATISGMRKKVVNAALQGLCGGSSGGVIVADIGCGTGSVSRAIAVEPGVAKVIGFDPCPYFLERARAMSKAEMVDYIEASCTEIPLPDNSVDLVVMIHVLSHVPRVDHKAALLEARRILKDGGRIMLKDNDLAGWSLTYGPTDPLSAPVETLLNAWGVDGRHLCRDFPSMLLSAGFVPDKLRIYHVLDDEEDTYGFEMVLMRSIRMHLAVGKCTKGLAIAMEQEARRRVETKTFQCLLTYGVCIGYKLASR